MEEILLDVRELEPPEPYERATELLGNLEHGQYLKMISPRRPLLLYPWLQEHGLSEQTVLITDERYHIFAWKGDDPDAADIQAVIATD